MDFLLSMFSWLNLASGGFEGDLMEIKWDKVVGVVICHHGFMLLIIVLFPDG